jgi:hypothetical protein
MTEIYRSRKIYERTLSIKKDIHLEFQHHLITWLIYDAEPEEQKKYGLDPQLACRLSTCLVRGRLPEGYSSMSELEKFLQKRVLFGKLKEEKGKVISKPAY